MGLWVQWGDEWRGKQMRTEPVSCFQEGRKWRGQRVDPLER
jgi:hypothetical protein